MSTLSLFCLLFVGYLFGRTFMYFRQVNAQRRRLNWKQVMTLLEFPSRQIATNWVWTCWACSKTCKEIWKLELWPSTCTPLRMHCDLVHGLTYGTWVSAWCLNSGFGFWNFTKTFWLWRHLTCNRRFHYSWVTDSPLAIGDLEGNSTLDAWLKPCLYCQNLYPTTQSICFSCNLDPSLNSPSFLSSMSLLRFWRAPQI